MKVRFVYLVRNYGFDMLLIQRENEDGYCWDFNEEGLTNYLEEYDLDIEDIRWLVKADPEGSEFAEILASSPKEWFAKFKELRR